MLKKRGYIVPCLLLLICQACIEDLENCTRRDGRMIEKTLTLDPISGVEAWDGVNIILHQAEEQKVVVKAGENVMQQIKLSVNEGILSVRDENRCDWARAYQDREVHVYLPLCSTIIQNGYGYITSFDSLYIQDLQIEARKGIGSIDLKIKGSKANVVSSRYGTISLEGEVQYLLVQYLSNNAIFEGSKLQAKDIEIFHKSNNDFHLYPLQSLSGRLIKQGNVYLYHQVKSLDVQITGTGKMIPMYQE